MTGRAAGPARSPRRSVRDQTSGSPGVARVPVRGPATVLLAALLLASCGAAEGGTGSAAPTAPTGRTGPAGPGGPSASVAPGELVVLVAASLAEVVEELADDVEAAEPGVEVTVVPGPSSGLAQQVLAGSPGDVLVSAAPAPVQQLLDAGEVLDGPYDVARNSPVLAVPAGNPGGVTALADLADEELVVSLCEPQVPCGAVAAELLADGGVEAAPDSLERDVRAVLTRLELGEADAGIVYRTDALAAGDAVEVVEVPGADDVVTTYPAVVLAGTTDRTRARAFVQVLRGPAGADALARAGFELP